MGKGTFAKILCSQHGWKHFSIGDVMREEVARGSELGVQIHELMSTGKLVPDDLANNIAFDYLDRDANLNSSVLIDGYPRTVNQAELLLQKCKHHKLSAMHIKLDQAVCIEKLLARKKCNTCGRGFNSAHIVNDGYDMPAIMPDPKTCPMGPTRCVPLLSARSDDTRETIDRRFLEFYRLTTPVLDFLRRSGKLKEFTVTKGVADEPSLFKELSME